MKEKQELHCHACDRYVQFYLDMELNGNHVLKCPNCKHEHCRVVENGKITGDRWDQRNGVQSYSVPVHSITSTTTSTWDSYSGTANISGGTGTSTFCYMAWTTAT